MIKNIRCLWLRDGVLLLLLREVRVLLHSLVRLVVLRGATANGKVVAAHFTVGLHHRVTVLRLLSGVDILQKGQASGRSNLRTFIGAFVDDDSNLLLYRLCFSCANTLLLHITLDVGSFRCLKLSAR